MNRLQLASRREFLGGVFSAGALVFAVSSTPGPAEGRDVSKAMFHPSIWIGIDTDGAITIVAHRSEMGTGIRTALPMVVADELGADWQRVRVEQAIGDEKYGSQDTDGSQSIRDFYDIMRQAGASGRLMLEQAAAAQWNVPVSECKGANHVVAHVLSGKKLGYGELASAAAKLPLPSKENLRLKSPAEFKYIGKGVPLVDLKDICTGRSVYGFDMHVPGMVYASIERPPVLGGKLKTFDDAATKAVLGVQQTVVLNGAKPPYGFQALGGVAVIADNTWAASQGRKKLKVEWESGRHAIFDSSHYKQQLIDTANKPQQVVRTAGDVDSAFGGANKLVEANYYTPLLAHAPMEPPRP